MTAVVPSISLVECTPHYHTGSLLVAVAIVAVTAVEVRLDPEFVI